MSWFTFPFLQEWLCFRLNNIAVSMQGSMQQPEQHLQRAQLWFKFLPRSLKFFLFSQIYGTQSWLELQVWGWLRTLFLRLIRAILQFFQTLSSWATSSVEEVASTGPGIRFFQLYVRTIYKEFSRIITSNILYYHQLFTASFV